MIPDPGAVILRYDPDVADTSKQGLVIQSAAICSGGFLLSVLQFDVLHIHDSGINFATSLPLHKITFTRHLTTEI